MEKTAELVSASVSDRGLSEKRPQNEDSFVELPQYGVFAVADGVGGANAGDFASQMAMELLTEAVSNRPDSSDPEDLFRMAIEHANRSIHQMATDLPQLSSMATTIVALHLRGNIATVAHVGDSRIYRFTPDGKAIRETQDHSVVEEEVRAGRLTREEAAVHPSRNVISRAVGAESTVDVDVKTIMVEPNTTFLLCSDGITRHIDDDELEAIFATGAEPRLICDHLKEVCFSRGAEDNLTAVIVRTFAEAEEEIDDFDSTVPVMDEETVASARTAYAAAGTEALEPVAPPTPASLEDTISVIDPEEAGTGEAASASLEDTISVIDPEEAGTGEAVPGSLEDTISVIDLEEADTDQLNGRPENPAIVETADAPQIVEPLAEKGADKQFLLSEIDDEPELHKPEPGSYTSSSVVVPAQAANRQSGSVIFADQDQYQEPAPARGGVGRILISLGLLLLGAAIAVGVSYFLGFTGQNQEEVAVPQVETMKTQNIPLTSFEEARRTVDKDPAAYTSKVTATPSDAADFYLLGRALLLTGKTAEAKKQFELARERLPLVDESERKTLANEIALGLAVVDSPQAIESFQTATTQATGPTAASANSPNR